MSAGVRGAFRRSRRRNGPRRGISEPARCQSHHDNRRAAKTDMPLARCDFRRELTTRSSRGALCATENGQLQQRASSTPRAPASCEHYCAARSSSSCTTSRASAVCISRRARRHHQCGPMTRDLAAQRLGRGHDVNGRKQEIVCFSDEQQQKYPGTTHAHPLRLPHSPRPSYIGRVHPCRPAGLGSCRAAELSFARPETSGAGFHYLADAARPPSFVPVMASARQGQARRTRFEIGGVGSCEDGSCDVARCEGEGGRQSHGIVTTLDLGIPGHTLGSRHGCGLASEECIASYNRVDIGGPANRAPEQMTARGIATQPRPSRPTSSMQVTSCGRLARDKSALLRQPRRPDRHSSSPLHCCIIRSSPLHRTGAASQRAGPHFIASHTSCRRHPTG